MRKIRVSIAEANGIDYKPLECYHEDPCPGTCPLCDSELVYLEKELQKKRDREEEICNIELLEEDLFADEGISFDEGVAEGQDPEPDFS